MPSRSDVVQTAGQELGGFRKFLLRGNVVDLAVGLVVGAAFCNVIQALVKDLLTPLLGLVGGQPDLSGLTVTIAGQPFVLGNILNALLSFLLIAAVVYFLVVLPVNKLMDRYRPEPPPAPTRDCPECLTKIPQAARRCRACAAQLAPPSDEVAAAMRQVAAPSGTELANEAARVLSERLTGER